MTTPPDVPELDLLDLLDSWTLALSAERKSAQTIKSYRAGVEQFVEFHTSRGAAPVLDKRHVQMFINALADQGREGSTLRARQLSLRRFSAFLVDEGELSADPLVGLKAPKLDAKVVEPLTDDQVKALIKACSGREFYDRRDEALVRLMVETGLRAGEAAAMRAEDVDLLRGTVIIRRGKGGKGRVVPFGPQTARALDRYRRLRAQHRLAHTDAWWLGDRGRAFSYDALHKTLKARAVAAGLAHFHPHLLRHTAAHRWLAAGGSESGLMAVAGWERPDMLQRYTRARATDRAIAESRNLNLGDL